jgi:hypothetical protein
MMNDKTVNYKIVNKDGKVVEDLSFNDYDKLADHMLEMADKYYRGVLTTDDTISITTLDSTGNLVYEDTASFDGAVLEEEELTDEFRNIITDDTDTAGKGFGEKSK